jgi:hypothetical protein
MCTVGCAANGGDSVAVHGNRSSSAGSFAPVGSGSGTTGTLGTNPFNTGTGPSTLIPPGGGSSDVDTMPKVCASAVVQTSKNMPSIVFVIDGSGSMCAQFGGSTRWQALRTALLDPAKGLIYRLQNSVSFGATLYDGTIDLGLALAQATGGEQNPACSLMYVTMKNTGDCPQLVEVMPPALNNAMAIDKAYPMVELGGSTPTDKTMKHVMDALVAGRHPPGPDQKPQSPVYVILATDGAPNDICMNGMGGDGSVQRQGVVAAVDEGAAAGIVTWVISLAGGDAMLQAHLDDVAKHGDPANKMAHTFSPTNPDDLIMTLAKLLGGAVGCHVALNGTVKVGQECLGTVQQNGKVLPCCQQAAGGAWTCNNMSVAAPNGWHLTDDHSLELIGDACTNFLLGAGDVLQASFPCTVFSPS